MKEGTDCDRNVGRHSREEARTVNLKLLQTNVLEFISQNLITKGWDVLEMAGSL